MKYSEWANLWRWNVHSRLLRIGARREQRAVTANGDRFSSEGGKNDLRLGSDDICTALGIHKKTLNCML